MVPSAASADAAGAEGGRLLRVRAQRALDLADAYIPSSPDPVASLVGHSQGGLMPRYFISYLGGAGSAFLRDLNAGDEPPGEASYTQVVTRYDEVVVPYASGHLAPDANVTNLTLRDICPDDTSEHLRAPYDPPAIGLTLDALGRSGPADPGFRPACTTF